jgi:hypothetical protein
MGGFLPPNVSSELVALMRQARIEDRAAREFTAICSDLVQVVFADWPDQTHQEVKDELKGLQKAAGNLVQALGPDKLGAPARQLIDARELVTRAAAPKPLDDKLQLQDLLFAATGMRLLAVINDLAQALQELSAHAIERMADQGNRVRNSEVLGTRLIGLVAGVYQDRFGKLPPQDKRSWFALYMQRIAEHTGLGCGVSATESAVKALKAQARQDSPPRA